MLRKIIGAGAVFLAITLGAPLAQDKGGKAARAAERTRGPRPHAHLARSRRRRRHPRQVHPESWPEAPVSATGMDQRPMGAQTFALLFHDPDGLQGKKIEDVTHWMVFNIPGTARGLPGGVPRMRSSPMEPSRSQHRESCRLHGPGSTGAWSVSSLHLRVVRLDTKLDLGPDATRADVVKAMDGHVSPRACSNAASTSKVMWSTRSGRRLLHSN